MPGILVYEHICAGGLAEPALAALLPEARAMLAAVLADLAALPAARPVVLLAEELPTGGWPPATCVRVRPDEAERRFAEAVAATGATLLIAPEIGGILARLAELVESLGRPLLGPSAAAIRLAADKLATEAALAAAGLPVPGSVEWPLGTPPPAVPLPAVVKPRDGADCRGVFLVEEPSQFAAAAAVAGGATEAQSLLVQPRLPGVHASVSLVGDGQRAFPLSLNSQRVRPGRPFRYLGGETPLDHPHRDRALAIARAAAEAIPGLRGYFGVDLVLTPDGPVVVEVNPRLTTAYLGVRAALDANLAELMLAAAAGRLPEAVRLVRRVRFDPGGVRAGGRPRPVERPLEVRA